MNKQEKRDKEFMQRLSVMTPEEFLGIAKLFSIPFTEEVEGKVKPRQAEQLLEDVLGKWAGMAAVRKMRMLKLMRAATVGRELPKEVKHGPSTEH